MMKVSDPFKIDEAIFMARRSGSGRSFRYWLREAARRMKQQTEQPK